MLIMERNGHIPITNLVMAFMEKYVMLLINMLEKQTMKQQRILKNQKMMIHSFRQKVMHPI